MFRSAYSDKPRVKFATVGASRTKQAMKQECDINFIVDRYRRTGVLQHVKESPGSYGDFEAMEYQEALNTVMKAQSDFNALPSAVRNRFANEPALFLEFIRDPANIEEAQKLGLLRADYKAPVKEVQGAEKARRRDDGEEFGVHRNRPEKASNSDVKASGGTVAS